MAGQYFRGAFLSQELIHPVVVVGVDGSQLGSRVGAVIERDKQAPGVTRSAEFIVDVALDGSPLLVRRYAVIKRQQHRREEAVADIVEVERADFSVELDVIRSANVIGQAVIKDSRLIGFDLIHYSRVGAVF